RGLQGAGDTRQHGRAHAVGAAFVLLDLLEGDARGLGQRLLRETPHLAQQADAGPDGDIDGVGKCFGLTSHCVSGNPPRVHPARLAGPWLSGAHSETPSAWSVIR